MKLIAENWNKFLEEAEERHVAKLGRGSNDSFQDIFGSSSRLIMNYESTDLDRMNELVTSGVHSVQIERKNTRKEDRIITTSVPMVSYTAFKIKFNPETRKRSIGEKIIKQMSLEKFTREFKKFTKDLPVIRETYMDMDHNRATGLVTTFIKFIGKDIDPNNLTSNPHYNLRFLLAEAGGDTFDEIQQKADELHSLFQKNKGELTGRSVEWPGDTSNVLFILSRDEIDVLRMSDHDGLDSCHSLDGGYDQCVLADAKRDGAIIYSVLKSDFEDLAGGTDQAKLDALEGKEIFKDETRNVEGIVPTGRVRVRKVSLQGIEFAVVEDALYGKFPVGSRYNIFKDLTYSQKDKYEKLKQPIDIGADGISYGGSATDTGFESMIKESLSLLGIQYDESAFYMKHSSLETDSGILDSISEGDYEYSKKIGDSTISSHIWISDNNNGVWFEDASWIIEAKIDISSMKGKIDFEKLRSTLSTMYYTGLKGFDEFKKYFPGIDSQVSLVQKGEKIFLDFSTGDLYGSLDDLAEAVQELDITRWEHIDDYSKSINDLLKNPNLLLDIFADFVIERPMSESLFILKSKFKRLL